MNIIGIDPGVTRSGYAIVDEDGHLVESGVVDTAHVDAEVEGWPCVHGVAFTAVVEDQFVHRGHPNLRGAIALAHAAGEWAGILRVAGATRVVYLLPSVWQSAMLRGCKGREQLALVGKKVAEQYAGHPVKPDEASAILIAMYGHMNREAL